MAENDILLNLRVTTNEARKDIASFQKYVNGLQSAASKSDGKQKVAQLPREVGAKLGNSKQIVNGKDTAELKKQEQVLLKMAAERARLVALAQTEAQVVAKAAGKSASTQKLSSIKSGALKSIAASMGLDEVPKAIEKEFGRVLTATKKQLNESLANLQGQALQTKFRQVSKPILQESGITSPTRLRQASSIVKDNERLDRQIRDRKPTVRRVQPQQEEQTQRPKKTRASEARTAKAAEDQASTATRAASAAKSSADSQKASAARSDKAMSRKAAADEKAAKAAEQAAEQAGPGITRTTTRSKVDYAPDGRPLTPSPAPIKDTTTRPSVEYDIDGKAISGYTGSTSNESKRKQLEAEKRTTEAKQREAKAAEKQATEEELQAGVLFGEAPPPEKIRKGTIPVDEPAPVKKEKFKQTDFLAQELTIEDALNEEAQATSRASIAELELVKLKEQEKVLQEKINAKNAEKMKKLQESAEARKSYTQLSAADRLFPSDSEGYMITPPGYQDKLDKLSNDRYNAEQAALVISYQEEKIQKERTALLEKIRAKEQEILATKLAESGVSLEAVRAERARQQTAALRGGREDQYGTRFDRKKKFGNFALDNPDQVRSIKVPEKLPRKSVERLTDIYPLDPSVADIDRGKLMGPDPGSNYLKVIKGKEKEIRDYLQKIVDDAERQLGLIAQELAQYDQSTPPRRQSSEQRQLNKDKDFYEENLVVAKSLLEEEKKTAAQIEAENTKQVAVEKETTKALERRREVLKPDAVIPPPGRSVVPTGEKISGTQSGFNGPVIDARSATEEERRRFAQDVFGKTKADRAAQGTRGVDPIVVEGEERKALVAKTKEAEAAQTQANIEESQVASLQQIQAAEAQAEAATLAAKKQEATATKVAATKAEKRAKQFSVESLPDSVNEKLSKNMKIALAKIIESGATPADLGKSSINSLLNRGLVENDGRGKVTAIPTDQMDNALQNYNAEQNEIKRAREEERKKAAAEEEAFVRSLYSDMGPEGEKLVQSAKQYRAGDTEERRKALVTELDDAKRSFYTKWYDGVGEDIKDEMGRPQAVQKGRRPILGQKGGEFDFLQTLKPEDRRNVEQDLFDENATKVAVPPATQEAVDKYVADLARIKAAENELAAYRSKQPPLSAYADRLYREFPQEFTPTAPPVDVNAQRLAKQTEDAAMAVKEPTGDPKSAAAIAEWQSVIESELRQTAQEYEEQLVIERQTTQKVKAQSSGDDKVAKLKAEYAALIERKIILERALVESRNKVKQIDTALGDKNITTPKEIELKALRDREIAQQRAMDAQLTKIQSTAIPAVQSDFVKSTKGDFKNNDDALDALDNEVIGEVKKELRNRIGLGENVKVHFDLSKEILALDRKLIEEKRKELAAAADNRPRQVIGGQEYVVLNEAAPQPPQPVPAKPKPIPVETVTPVETVAPPVVNKPTIPVSEDKPAGDLGTAEAQLIAALEKKTFLITSQAEAVEKRLPAFIEAETQLIKALERKAGALNAQTGETKNSPYSAPGDSGKKKSSGGGGGDAGITDEEGRIDEDEAIKRAERAVVNAYNKMAEAIALQTEGLIGEIAEYKAGFAAVNRTINKLAAGAASEIIATSPELKGDYTYGGAKDKAYGKTLQAGILDQMIGDPALNEEYVKSQLKLIGLNDKLAEEIAAEIVQSPKAVKAKAQRIAAEAELAAAIDREVLATGLGPQVDRKVANQARNVAVEAAALDDPQYQELIRQKAENAERAKKIRTGQDKPVGLIGRITRAAGYERAGGSSLQEFFGGGALASLRYGLPSMALYGAASGITDSIKEAEQLQYVFSKLEEQVKSVFGGESEAAVSNFKNAIIDVSIEAGLAADELGKTALKIIGTFATKNIDGKSGQALVESQIVALGKLQRVTGLTAKELENDYSAISLAFNATFENIADKVVAISDITGIDATELGNFAGDIATVLTEAGFTLDEALALGATSAQSSGKSISAISEAYGRVIPQLATQTAELNKLAAENPQLNTPEFIDAVRLQDASKILTIIGQKYDTLSKSAQVDITSLFGRREAQSVLPGIKNQQGYQDALNAAENSTGEFQDRFDKVMENLSSKLAKLGEEVRIVFKKLLEGGLGDVLDMFLSIGSAIAKGLTAGISALIKFNDVAAGVPMKILAIAAAWKILKLAQGPAQNFLANRQSLSLGSNGPGGAGRAQYLPNFLASASAAYQTRLNPRVLPAGYAGPQLPAALASQRMLGTRTAALAAGGKDLLSTLGGGSALAGGAFIGITALTTAYQIINNRIAADKAAIAKLNEQLRTETSELDLTDVDVRRGRVEKLQGMSEAAGSNVAGWKDDWKRFWDDLFDIQTEAAAYAIEAIRAGRDPELIKILDEANAAVEEKILQTFINTGSGFGTIVPQAPTYGKKVDDPNNYFVQTPGGGAQKEDIAKLVNVKKFEQVNQDVLNALNAKDKVAALQRIVDTNIDPEAVKQAQAALDNVAQELLTGNSEEAKAFRFLKARRERNAAQLKELENSKSISDLSELANAYNSGVITLEEYLKRSSKEIGNIQNSLKPGGTTVASEEEKLAAATAIEEGRKQQTQAILDSQDKQTRIAEALGAKSEDLDAIKVAAAKANLADPNFSDDEKRLDAALLIVQAQGKAELALARKSGNINKVYDLIKNGFDVPPETMSILLTETVQNDEQYKAFETAYEKYVASSFGSILPDSLMGVDSATGQLKGLSADDLLSKVAGESFSQGGLTPQTQNDLMSAITYNQNLLEANPDLPAEAKDQIEKSIDYWVELLKLGGVSTDKILNALSGGEYSKTNPGSDARKAIESKFADVLGGYGFDPKAIKAMVDAQNLADAKALEQSRGDYYNATGNKGAYIEALKAGRLVNQPAADAARAKSELDRSKEDWDALKEEAEIDNEIKAIAKEARDARNAYLATVARVSGDLVGAISIEISGLQEDLKATNDPAEQDQINSQIVSKYDELRKQAVADANAMSKLAGGLASLRGDLTEAALYALQEANNNAAAARTPQEKADAALAQAQANADLIKAQFTEKSRDFDLFAAYLESNGDSVNAIRTQVAKAKAGLDAAIAGGNKDDINAARIELLNQEASLRKAVGSKRDGDFQLLSKILAGDDPVKQAILEQAAAKEALARAVGPDEIRDATIRVIDANRAMIASKNEVRLAMMGLRQAELQAVEDEVGAAQVGVAIARQQLNDLIKAGAGDAAIANGRAALITADKAAKDAVFQERQDEYKWLLDMGKISKSQYIDYLEGLKSTLIPGTKQFRDLELSIKQLKDDIGGDLQANLPTSLKLPTLYEVRRFDQTGASSGGATAGGVGYQDNRQVAINVNIDGASQDVAGQVVQAMQEFAGIQNNGYGVRRF